MSELDSVSGRQKAALRYLWEKRTRGNGYFARAQVMADTALTDSEYDTLLSLLDTAGHVDIVPVDDGVFASDFSVGSSLGHVIQQLDNPDYTTRAENWFRKSRLLGPVWFLLKALGFAK